MKVLIVGNHTCGNRGDAAILRGLVSELRTQELDIELEILSRFPTSSSYLLDESVAYDPLDAFHRKNKGLKGKYYRALLPWMLHFSMRFIPDFILPKHVHEFIEKVQSFDAVIQVGGSFFVDLYGTTQFEHALCVLKANKPIYLLGHSVGPFNRPRFNKLAKYVFNKVEQISLREAVSLELFNSLQAQQATVKSGADSAWLVRKEKCDLDYNWRVKLEEKPTVAITARLLAPFDKRLGISQEVYEKAFAQLIEQLIERGYRVALFSTCTGIESYNRDDRMVGLKIAAKVKNTEECIVIMEELNDVELGHALSKCVLTIGTRLHSAIISMNFDTPAIALNYEHKSKGIMAQLGIPECSSELSRLVDGSLSTDVFSMLSKIENASFDIKGQVEDERARARKMVVDFIHHIKRSAK